MKIFKKKLDGGSLLHQQAVSKKKKKHFTNKFLYYTITKVQNYSTGTTFKDLS